MLLRGGGHDGRVSNRRAVDTGASENRADSGVGVLQVWRCVAIESQHAVPVEDVVLDTIGRQVRVLHRADTDLACHFSPVVGAEIGVLLGNCPPGTLYCFVEEVDQLHRIT